VVGWGAFLCFLLAFLKGVGEKVVVL